MRKRERIIKGWLKRLVCRKRRAETSPVGDAHSTDDNNKNKKIKKKIKEEAEEGKGKEYTEGKLSPDFAPKNVADVLHFLSTLMDS